MIELDSIKQTGVSNDCEYYQVKYSTENGTQKYNKNEFVANKWYRPQVEPQGHKDLTLLLGW